MVSKRTKIEEILKYHGYRVSEACIDALEKIEDDNVVVRDSWFDESDTGDFYDSWGYRKNRSSWE